MESKNKGSVCASLLMMVVDFCKTNNLDIPEECTRYFNQDFTILNDIYARVSLATWCNILYKIHRQYPVAALGLKIAEHVQPSYAGILTYLAFSNPNLFDALPDFINYSRLVYDYQYLNFDIKNDEIEFSWSDYNELSGLLVDELFIAVFVKILKLAIYPHELPVRRIHFIYKKPKNTGIYEEFFQCPVYFDMPLSGVVFSISGFKNVTLSSPDEILYEILKQQVDRLVEELKNYNDFEQRIYLSIVSAIKDKDVSMEAVAKNMEVTVTKLRQILIQKELDFSDLLADTRYKLAQQYLKKPKLSINAISEMLGYSEQSSFQRAFKVWSGTTPLKWRKMNRA